MFDMCFLLFWLWKPLPKKGNLNAVIVAVDRLYVEKLFLSFCLSVECLFLVIVSVWCVCISLSRSLLLSSPHRCAMQHTSSPMKLRKLTSKHGSRRDTRDKQTQPCTQTPARWECFIQLQPNAIMIYVESMFRGHSKWFEGISGWRGPSSNTHTHTRLKLKPAV